jgi:hypothetical protein
MSHMARYGWLFVCAGLTACSDGYEGDSTALHLHYDMSLQETLVAMNQSSEKFHAKRFELQDRCVLAWDSDLGKQSVTLLAQEAVLVQGSEGKGYDIVLTTAAAGDDKPGIAVVRDASWIEAVQMKWLLTYIQRFC